MRRATGLILLSTLVAALLAIGPAASALPASPTSPAVRQLGESPRVVTLVTGDRVTVEASGGLGVTPRPGVRFFTYGAGDHRYVIPSDAVPLLAADRIDRRLFDLTALLELPEHRQALPLIVAGVGAAPRIPTQLTVTRRLPVVRGYAAIVDHHRLPSYWRSLKTSSAVARGASTGKVWLDAIRTPTLDSSVPQVRAPVAWEAGFDGTGVTVAVLDTGIDVTHPDLAGKVTAAGNFVADFEDERDLVGHGTHVASIVAGTGAASGGAYRGVAPGASLLNGKVCARFGCPESAILAAMQWAADQDADVVNMSLGGPDTPDIDPIEQAVNELTAAADLLFVIAAGNDGEDETLSSPASADAALAVGAVDDFDALADFSSRGPRLGPDAAVKPEVTAPGVDITAANSKDGFLGTPGEPYTTVSGTSMSTPHVAGAAAVLTQQHPSWTAVQRKATLMASADPNPQIPVFGQGAGRLDVGRAISQRVTTSPFSVAFGRQEFPHDDDEIRSQVVTYRNSGSTALTLDLSLTTTAPEEMFTLSATTITVPPSGLATATLTSDTRVEAEPGFYGGQLTATGPNTRVETPFGVVVEPQMFTLTLDHIARSGKPADSFVTFLVDIDNFNQYVLFPGQSEVRVQLGRYLLFSWIDDITEEGEQLSTAQLVYPLLTVDQDQAVALDARRAGGFTVTVPDRRARSILGAFDAQMDYDNGNVFGVGVFGDSLSRIFSAQVGPRQPRGVDLMSWITATYAVPAADGSFGASRAIYHVSAFDQSRLMAGLTKRVKRSDLATVRASYAAHATDTGLKFAVPRPPDALSGVAVAYDMPLPQARAEYYTADTPWEHEFDEVALIGEEQLPEFVTSTFTDPIAYRAGKTYREPWNQAVFGPTLPGTHAIRDGNVIFAAVPLFDHSYGRRWTFSLLDEARTALYRNGQLVGEFPDLFGEFEVPRRAANYRLEVSAERADPFRLSTRVSAMWTFGSRQADEPVVLPLTAIGFRPPVDGHNRVTSKVAIIPVTTWQQPDSDTPAVKKLRVSVSFDDGATWRSVPVLRVGKGWQVIVKHRSLGGFVSLRATGEDTAGNTFNQTVIRAYQTAGR